MSAKASDTRPSRRLRLVLRDHRVLDASARIPEGETLTAYLGSRARYMELDEVDWVGTGSATPRVALKVDRVLWGASPDDAVPLTWDHGAGALRRVEVELDGGYLVRAGLRLDRDQRLAGYLRTAPAFVPLLDAELMPRGKRLGDIAVNQDAVQVVRELGDEEDPPA